MGVNPVRLNLRVGKYLQPWLVERALTGIDLDVDDSSLVVGEQLPPWLGELKLAQFWLGLIVMEVEQFVSELEGALIELGLSLAHWEINALERLQPWRAEIDLVARELDLFSGLHHEVSFLHLFLFVLAFPYRILVFRGCSLSKSHTTWYLIFT